MLGVGPALMDQGCKPSESGASRVVADGLGYVTRLELGSFRYLGTFMSSIWCKHITFLFKLVEVLVSQKWVILVRVYTILKTILRGVLR